MGDAVAEPCADAHPSARVQGTLIALDQVGKVYPGPNATRALRDINLTVCPGEFVAILGPSGSGKSTLLHLAGALDRPTEGTVRIAGESLTDLDDEGLARLRRRHIGFIFQFHYLMPDFNVLENVLMPTALSDGWGNRAAEREARELLERVGLGDKWRNRATDLSGGQQQRVAVARALAGGKSLVLADEPTGNLDTRNSHAVFRLLREFRDREGTTFMIVTHDLHLASQADRIVTIVDGSVEDDRRNLPLGFGNPATEPS
ncbi:MAG TPA: ABC transporter ATP-binding protein [Chthonomonadales bacterium]|nr:ABC transporter ATP-binding protein [Chthonomonadales bacterium]